LPTPTQPYPANVTIKKRDTMPCKHGRPPYPAEVRQPVSLSYFANLSLFISWHISKIIYFSIT
jgi:hypothetical protein